MALNPQYDAIGKGFVQQYYTLFDDPAQRANLANMYNVSIKNRKKDIIRKFQNFFNHCLSISKKF